MRLLALAVAVAALQAPPKTHRATRLAATQQLDVGCWMLLVPELNALPGRHAYDQTEFLNTDRDPGSGRVYRRGGGAIHL